MNRILLLACVALAISLSSLIYIATRQPTNVNAEELTVTSTVSEDVDVEELRQDGRVRENWWPAWDADPLVYIVIDKDDRTNNRWVSEWTPHGNKHMRCIVYSGGGLDCFTKGAPRRDTE